MLSFDHCGAITAAVEGENPGGCGIVMMASGFFPAGTFAMILSVFRSKMKIVTVEDCPPLTNPRPTSAAMAMPCTPRVFSILPTIAPESRSRTSAWVP